MDILSFLLIGTNYILIFFFTISSALDTITPSQSVSDGNTIISRDRSFELGFFSPGSSKNRYVGIWYKNIPIRTVVWVANRQNPINDSSGLLMIDSTAGSLVLLNQNKSSVVWSTNSTKEAQYPIVQLLDSGNLVLRDGNSDCYLWQSFDYPSDTMLPGMKLGRDLRTGLNRRLSSWKNLDDPSPGDFTWEIELYDNPEGLTRKGSEKYYRSGPWNGISFGGAPPLSPNMLFNVNFVSNNEEVYYIFQLGNKSVPSMLFMNQTNYLRQRLTWNEATQTWKLFGYVPRDFCDTYALCGAYGHCTTSAMPVCQCLKGFKPKSPEKWNMADWSQGCLHSRPLNCSKGDGFVKFSGLKLPEATHSWVNKFMNLKECKAKCLQNCSCMAYTNFDIRGKGSGCAIWFGDLIDIRSYPTGGQDLYIRMSASELEANNEPMMKIAVIIVIATVVASGLLIVSYIIYKRRANSKEKRKNMVDEQNNEDKKVDLELLLFDMATIANATDNFSASNKLGEGGFGPVYKGTLLDGQEIAVKRLSRISGQGINEFKNEVELITKLQHRNLVKLLGCCVQGEEKVLIYEYMPNKSLDFFIFDQTRGRLLDWSKRFHIICGIARGLLYLHQDSRLRIIHRDLKASNVLLDNDLNPKISDFGMARTFGGDQTQGNTNRVVGTYGYMAPEYAIDGLFSVKSDVFSFGILLLEIISGKKNRGFYHRPNHSLNLIGYAWSLWNEDKHLELIDPFLGESCTLSEVIRCIHISLLCVQQYPEDRPSLSSVVLMLGSESALPSPKQPGFFKPWNPLEAESSSTQREPSSINEVSMTLLEAR